MAALYGANKLFACYTFISYKTIDWKELSRHRKAYRNHLWSVNWVWRCDNKYWNGKKEWVYIKILPKTLAESVKGQLLVSVLHQWKSATLLNRKTYTLGRENKNELLLVIVKNNTDFVLHQRNIILTWNFSVYSRHLLSAWQSIPNKSLSLAVFVKSAISGSCPGIDQARDNLAYLQSDAVKFLKTRWLLFFSSFRV